MRVRTRPFADRLERDGEALVLLADGAGLVRLSAMGAAIVDLALNGIDLDTLAEALESRFGAPPEGSARELADRMVAELSEQGVLEFTALPVDAVGRHWRISDDTAFVLSSSERVVVLNLAAPAESPRALLGTAASVWHALAGEGGDLRPWVAEQDLLDDLAEAYATEATAIADDVRTLLEGLADAGYVELSPGAEDPAHT